MEQKQMTLGAFREITENMPDDLELCIGIQLSGEYGNDKVFKIPHSIIRLSNVLYINGGEKE